MNLIYCGDGNPTLAMIAIEEGWLYGFRSDKRPGAECVSFVDIDYKRPDFERHLETVKRYRPKYATVPDLSEEAITSQDIDRAIEQAERLAPHCEIVLIVPKLSGQLALLPADIAVGYSVPSRYGGASYPIWELAGRRVHLLGGSPRKQMQVYLHLSGISEVLSLDGNYPHKMAISYAMYWERDRWQYHPRKDSGDKDLYQECWRWSCRNLLIAWEKLTSFQ